MWGQISNLGEDNFGQRRLLHHNVEQLRYLLGMSPMKHNTGSLGLVLERYGTMDRALPLQHVSHTRLQLLCNRGRHLAKVLLYQRLSSLLIQREWQLFNSLIVSERRFPVPVIFNVLAGKSVIEKQSFSDYLKSNCFNVFWLGVCWAAQNSQSRELSEGGFRRRGGEDYLWDYLRGKGEVSRTVEAQDANAETPFLVSRSAFSGRGEGGQIEIRVFLDNEVITFEFSEILSVAVQMKATEQYFHLVLLFQDIYKTIFQNYS